MYAEAGIVVPFIVMVWKRMRERAVCGGRVYAEVLASTCTFSRAPAGE